MGEWPATFTVVPPAKPLPAGAVLFRNTARAVFSVRGSSPDERVILSLFPSIARQRRRSGPRSQVANFPDGIHSSFSAAAIAHKAVCLAAKETVDVRRRSAPETLRLRSYRGRRTLSQTTQLVVWAASDWLAGRAGRPPALCLA